MSNNVEALARAAYNAFTDRTASRIPYDELKVHSHDTWERVAVAVVVELTKTKEQNE